MKFNQEDLNQVKQASGSSACGSERRDFAPSELDIAGGKLVQTAQGVKYIGDNGQCCCFWGVHFITKPVASGAAYQYSGITGISPDWINDSNNPFNVYNFAHAVNYLQCSTIHHM